MRAWLFGVLAIGLAGCSYEEGDVGGGCARSTECKRGLVCIEGACTGSLEDIEDPGTVPMLQPDAAAEPAQEPDAAVDAG
jgi:hypothetical protein